MLVEIVVGAGDVVGEGSHPGWIEEVSTDVVEGHPAGLRFQADEAEGEGCQLLDDGVAEVLVHVVEEIRRRLARLDVDRNPMPEVGVDGQNLKVGALPHTVLALDRLCFQNAVSFKGHINTSSLDLPLE